VIERRGRNDLGLDLSYEHIAFRRSPFIELGRACEALVSSIRAGRMVTVGGCSLHASRAGRALRSELKKRRRLGSLRR